MASSARIDELRKKFEENPRRYFAPLANEYRKAGQIDQAIAICREYLPQQPGHMSGHIVYGQALYEARLFEESKGVFETALSLDPENLIALRHLGDIALLIGDSDAARTWYRRVLEADPRNEEIQAQLLTLEQASTPTSTVAASPADEASRDASAGSSATTVIVDARQAPAVATPLRPSGEVRRQPWARRTPGASGAVTPATPLGQVAPTSKTLDVTPPASPRTDSALSEPVPTPTSTLALQLESPVAGASTSSDAGLLIESANVAGLETTSLTGNAQSPEAPMGRSAMADAPGKTETALPRLSLLDLPVATESSPAAPESGPFVTETMAELYLQQGHREEALRVYRALLEQRPGDPGLQGRVAMLEGEVAARTSASVASSGTPASSSMEEPPHESGEPTMREVLTAIAQRRPGFRPQPPRGNGRASVESGATEPQPGRHSVSPDVLAGLFLNAHIAAVDEGAALVLALAFTELDTGVQLPTPPALEGTPAHRASNELSLETVFGSGQGRTTGSVSYDQFFAQRPSGPQAPGNAVDPRDDVTHFTKWLEGLKRR